LHTAHKNDLANIMVGKDASGNPESLWTHLEVIKKWNSTITITIFAETQKIKDLGYVALDPQPRHNFF
jgi:hypothetical protein